MKLISSRRRPRGPTSSSRVFVVFSRHQAHKSNTRTISLVFHQLSIGWLGGLFTLVEFSYNNLIHSSTGYTPFFANIGYHPRWIMIEHLEILKNPIVEDRPSPTPRISCWTFSRFAYDWSHRTEDWRLSSSITRGTEILNKGSCMTITT